MNVLRLHDTAEGRVVDIEPREAGKFSMYVCGLTVYDVAHIGHGRMALVFDVLRRYLEWTGLDVTFVSNITDIEDKIIARANERGIPFEELTQTYEKVWYEALDRLGIERPDADPHATAYVDKMVAFIEPDRSVTITIVACRWGEATVRCGRASARISAVSATPSSSGGRCRRQPGRSVTSPGTSAGLAHARASRRRRCCSAP